MSWHHHGDAVARGRPVTAVNYRIGFRYFKITNCHVKYRLRVSYLPRHVRPRATRPYQGMTRPYRVLTLNLTIVVSFPIAVQFSVSLLSEWSLSLMFSLSLAVLIALNICPRFLQCHVFFFSVYIGICWHLISVPDCRLCTGNGRSLNATSSRWLTAAFRSHHGVTRANWIWLGPFWFLDIILGTDLLIRLFCEQLDW